MVLSLLTILNGIGATAIVLSGYIMGINSIISYIKTEKRLQLIVSLMGFSLGSFYLGGMISFLLLVFTGNKQNISPELASYLSGPVVPIAIICAMYLGFDLFNPEKKKIVMIIYSITGVVYFIAFFLFYEANVRLETPVEGEVADWGIKFIVMYITIFYIASVLFILSWGFYKLQKSVEGEIKHKAQQLSSGFTLYALGAIMDSMFSGFVVPIARIVMSIGIIFLNFGFLITKTKSKIDVNNKY